MAIAAVYLVFKPGRNSGRIISGILAFLWIWMGVVYHLLFFAVINKAAYLFGVVFIQQGILFLISGVFRNKLSFKSRPGVGGVTAVIMLIYALVVYPLSGYFLGHAYPSSPTFGLPCPTTIFTFGLLLLSQNKISVNLLIIPLIWSVIGFTAAFKFGMLEDTGLLIAGILTAAMTFLTNKKQEIASR
jgi:hypothetical protein